MSEECFLHGAIVTWGGPYPSTNQLLDELNTNAIAALESKQDWPALIPSMFSFQTQTTSECDTARYRYQVIHFGGSYNHMSDGWPIFLEKFETLLAQMCWDEVHLHLNIELHGSFDFVWKSLVNGRCGHGDKILPISEWTFEGGPRSFEI